MVGRELVVLYLYSAVILRPDRKPGWRILNPEHVRPLDALYAFPVDIAHISEAKVCAIEQRV